ncbi:MarR family winged helix-turn-helix transcriptional regulator [Paenibacillus pabuli]|uniref:MarR family winged helix-turn-helix transcriptional regulator n=1 Tax=Paenibacillus pabuli TaxID=1472 RepID=UPI001FFF32AE|nr:MarR family winged helix-turn-helix transcriptional regulator [Paenibacillus pabuli]UPK44209.1 winged helix-turn-helix transcriptional regulator [Paenibacillus pabuli]
MASNRDELEKLAYGTLRIVKEFTHAQNLRSDLDRLTFEILLYVKEQGAVRITDIASKLDLNPSSITRRIQGLKQSGHIVAVSDPNDLRSSLVTLSPLGEEELSDFLEVSIDGLAHILRDWNDSEVQRFAKQLLNYADAMRTWRLAKGADSNVGEKRKS